MEVAFYIVLSPEQLCSV